MGPERGCSTAARIKKLEHSTLDTTKNAPSSSHLSLIKVLPVAAILSDSMAGRDTCAEPALYLSQNRDLFRIVEATRLIFIVNFHSTLLLRERHEILIPTHV